MTDRKSTKRMVTHMREFGAVPLGPILWECEHAKTKTKCKVKAQTWFQARSLASIKMGVPPSEVDCRHSQQDSTHERQGKA